MKVCQHLVLGVFCVLGLLFAWCPNECAAWDNLLNVCVASNTQANFTLQKIGDNYLVCWEDSRRTGYKDIYGQMFDNNSNISWTAGGNLLVVAGAVVEGRTNYNSLSTIFLAPNSTNEFFLAWMEGTDTRDLNCYINCYNLSASPQWGAAGTTVQAGDSGTSASIATDGEGGVFASWYFGGWSIWYDRTRVAHFNSDGNVTISYGSMSDASGGNGAPANDSRMTYISPGVAIITWKDNNGGAYSGWKSLRAQKLDSTRAWGGIGVCLSLAPTVIENIVGIYDVVADGNGGIIGIWNDARYGNNDIFAQLVNGSGSILWGTGGMVVCTAAGTQTNPRLAADGSGGAVFAWEDLRDNGRQIFAQHFDSSGQAQWSSNGVQVSSIMGLDPRIIRASDGNYFILWADNDSDGGSTDELRVQKINSSAEKLWLTNGVVITDATSSAPSEYEIASDGEGGAIVVWKDGRSGNDDIYAQRVFSNGSLFSISAPTGISASDGTYVDRVLVTWNTQTNATSYEIWRNASNDSSSASQLTASETSTSYADTTVTQEKTYYYWVKARNSSGTSAFSDPDTGYSSAQAHTPVTDDFDGDGLADPAVKDSSDNWYIWMSGSGYQQGGPYALGVTGTAVTADFDGDGLADPAVMNSSGNWYICFSGSGYQTGGPYALGVSGTPVAADIDGDAKADPAVMDSSGNWNIWFSGSGYQLGGPYALGVTGTAVAADFDGDGLADPAVINSSGNWYIWMSGSGYQQGGPYALGQTGTPVAGDFDGDGLADPAVVSATDGWYVWFSAGGYAQGGPYALSVQ